MTKAWKENKVGIHTEWLLEMRLKVKWSKESCCLDI
jgi:hypothetical protein